MSAKLAAFALVALVLGLRSVSSAQKASEGKGQDSAAAASFSLDDDGCGGASNVEDVQCIGSYLKKLDAELNRVYQKALAAMPEKDNSDTRSSREQLRKSERAWLLYKDEDCTLIGGLTGGSNLWVTRFALNCEEGRFRERIKFLRKIANGEDVP